MPEVETSVQYGTFYVHIGREPGANVWQAWITRTPELPVHDFDGSVAISQCDAWISYKPFKRSALRWAKRRCRRLAADLNRGVGKYGLMDYEQSAHLYQTRSD